MKLAVCILLHKTHMASWTVSSPVLVNPREKHESLLSTVLELPILDGNVNSWDSLIASVTSVHTVVVLDSLSKHLFSHSTDCGGAVHWRTALEIERSRVHFLSHHLGVVGGLWEVRPKKRTSPGQGVSYRAEGCVAQGHSRLWTAVQVGLKCTTQIKISYKEILQGVATLCSEWPKETETSGLGTEVQCGCEILKADLGGQRDNYTILYLPPKELQKHPTIGRKVRTRRVNAQELPQTPPARMPINRAKGRCAGNGASSPSDLGISSLSKQEARSQKGEFCQ